MKKLLMMMALTAAVAAQASEKTDTVVVNEAKTVMIITNDTAQQVTIVGQDGNASYDKTVPLNEYKMRKSRKKNEKDDPWDTDFDFGVGVNTPLVATEGYGFATFRSWEIFLGLRFAYTPKKALQTYSFGLWCDWNTYGLSTNKMFTKDEQNVVGLTPYPQDVKNQTSRLSIFSLSVPLLFTQKLGHDSKCKVTLGPVVNFNVYGRLNTSYEQGDNELSISTKDINYRPVTLSVMGAFQYGDVAFYCKYSPISVMKKDKGPQFQSLTFGLHF